MTPLHHRTPLHPSTVLEGLHGAPVWLKLESAQPCGSFKLRGMAHACAQAVQRGARRIVTSSGGNAGIAVAWACRRLGVPVTVVVPHRTDARMRALIEAEGARVVVHGEVWDDAHAAAIAHAPTVGGAVVHPFDHPDVWEGHASLVAELRQQLPEPPDVLVLSVGGGGLLCGVVEGLHRVGWQHVPVVACETQGAASFARAVEAGEPVTLSDIESLALTLGAKRVCDRALEWANAHEIIPWQCTDRAAVAACSRFLDDHRVLVEPACGAALAAVYDGAAASRGRSAVVVVCGGTSVTRAKLDSWRSQVGLDPSTG